MKQRPPRRSRSAAANGSPPSRRWQALGARAGKPVAILRLAGFTGRARTRWCKSRAAAPGASTSRGRCSTASTSPTSRRRSTRAFARRADGVIQRHRRRADARRACRSPSRRSCWASRRRRRLLSRRPQRKCRRWRCRSMARASACGTPGSRASLACAALSDLSRGHARAVGERRRPLRTLTSTRRAAAAGPQ